MCRECYFCSFFLHPTQGSMTLTVLANVLPVCLLPGLSSSGGARQWRRKVINDNGKVVLISLGLLLPRRCHLLLFTPNLTLSSCFSALLSTRQSKLNFCGSRRLFLLLVGRTPRFDKKKNRKKQTSHRKKISFII